jgi:hypothetical protein
MDPPPFPGMHGGDSKKTFFNTVFSAAEEDKAEIMNVVQYALMAIVPIVALNKLIQRFIPEADVEKSSLEILAEIFFQIVIIFCGIIIIHRMIVYVPTYSGFKYENLSLTNVILAFLIIVLSIQTKMGIKVNILVDRLHELWNGRADQDDDSDKRKKKKSVKFSNQNSMHTVSQADYLDNSSQQTSIFPAAPVATTKQNTDGYDYMMGGGGGYSDNLMAANSVLGGSFGSFF